MKSNNQLSNHSSIRILVVDDHPAIREGLTLLLAPEGIIVCANASASADALTNADACQPDLALVDLSLGGEDGLLLIAALHIRNVPVLVYSMHDDLRHVEGAFTAGAMGYVTKREVHQVLVDAIRAVKSGHRFVSANAAIALTEQPTNHSEYSLSDQERQIYKLLGKGEGTQQIADTMGISARTVETYYARIQDKLKLSGMRELRRYAINNQI